MEQKELRDWEARCIQEEPPACKAGCPLGVDAKGFVSEIGKGNLATARAILEKSVPLAGIVARMCEAPCEQYCLRESLGGSVAMGMLERMCVNATAAKTKFLRLPPRPKKVAILGSGPSSLTVAFDLGKKGYPVTLYHLPNGPGSWLRSGQKSTLSIELLEEELARLTTLGVQYQSVGVLDESIFADAVFDALYIGQDDSLSEDFLKQVGQPDSATRAIADSNWFTGGQSAEEHEYRFITDVSEGREAAVSIDRFLQGASLTAARVELRHGKTDLYTSLEGVCFEEKILPAADTGYTEEEAQKEAMRCIECECLECVKRCAFLQDYGAYPKTYARRVYNNSAIVKGNHQANTFINSCSLCGQCETICPNDFSMADLCLDARRTMVKEDRMPGSAQWFALEEMRSARTEAALVRHAPGKESSTTLFYPGCQLAGIRPQQTLRLYGYLQELDPATGLWLDCCGAPGYWAGREDEFSEILGELEKIWTEMGEPLVLTGCSTCLKMFRDHLPKIKAESVWVLLAKQPPTTAKAGVAMALSDPCTSRHDKTTQTAVREMLKTIGQPLTPLPMSGEMTECCGFGGLMENADPKVAQKVTKARVEQTESEMLTYCAMCRDQLARTGKPVSHVLDLLFADCAHPSSEPSPTISERRINRRQLKKHVLEEYHGEQGLPANEWEEFTLHIDSYLVALLEERRILEDDIRQVLHLAKKQKSVLVHGKNGTRIASAKLGQVTFWVQYREEGGEYHIESCWSHRMIIVGGKR
ncbi:MAG: Fe-S oxidoreductase [Desulforhopalus sp.]|jgi:Fe-S oxidoreductase